MTNIYEEQLEFINKYMTISETTGRIHYRTLSAEDFDGSIERLQDFSEKHGNGRELFTNGRDITGRRIEYINGQLLHSDIVAFYLYHGRLPQSDLVHLNARNALDNLSNLAESHTLTEQQIAAGNSYLTKRENLIALIQNRFAYDPLAGTFEYIPLAPEYFKTVAEMNRYNARFVDLKPFTSADGNGYLEETIFGNRLKAHIVAYVLMNGLLPTDQLAFRDYNRANLKWSNICVRSDRFNHVT